MLNKAGYNLGTGKIAGTVCFVVTIVLGSGTAWAAKFNLGMAGAVKNQGKAAELAPRKSDSTTSTNESQSYFPLKVGNRWVYDYVSDGNKSTATFEITGTVPGSDPVQYILKKDLGLSNTTLSISTMNLYNGAGGAVMAYCGGSSTTKTIVSDNYTCQMMINSGNCDEYVSYHGQDSVTVPSGTYTAVHVKYYVDTQTNTTAVTSNGNDYYVKGIGLVSSSYVSDAVVVTKYYSGSTHVSNSYKLVSYTIVP